MTAPKNTPLVLPGLNGSANLLKNGPGFDGATNYRDSRNGNTVAVHVAKISRVGPEYVLCSVGERRGLIKIDRRVLVGIGKVVIGSDVLIGDIRQYPRPNALRAWILSCNGQIQTEAPDPLAESIKTVQIALDEITIDAANRGQNLWENRKREDWEHDLPLKHHAGVLRSIQIEYLDRNGVFVAGKTLAFDGDRNRRPPTSGVGQLICPRIAIRSHRLLISEGEVDPALKKRLRLNWATAETLKRMPSEVVANANSANRTGGRVRGEEEITSSAREQILVVRTGPKFAWAQTMDAKITGIFLHSDDAPSGFRFQVGDRLSAFLFIAPGITRAKSIRPIASSK